MAFLKEVGCQGRSHMQRNPSLDLLFLASSWKARIRDTVYAGFSFSSHTCVVWIRLESADRQGLGYACCFSTAFLGDVSLLSSAHERVPKGGWKFVSRSSGILGGRTRHELPHHPFAYNILYGLCPSTPWPLVRCSRSLPNLGPSSRRKNSRAIHSREHRFFSQLDLI